MICHINMKPFALGLAFFLLPVVLVMGARQSRAEEWCGDGPGTALSHPCTDVDDYSPAVDDAVAKYQDRWMRLQGVYSVDLGDTYHNRVPTILVHVDSASVAEVRKEIPSSVDGIPVEIVPGKMPMGLPSVAYLPIGPAENARRSSHPKRDASCVRREEDHKKAEDSYTLVVQKYGERWMNLPGVIGIGAKCDSNGCDFKTAEVTVQRELLPEAQREIPSSVYGVKIVLVPED